MGWELIVLAEGLIGVSASVASALSRRAGHAATLASSIAFVSLSAAMGFRSVCGYGEFLRDTLSWWGMLLVSLVYFSSSLSSPSFIESMIDSGELGDRGARLYYVLLNSTFTMLVLLVSSNNIFMQWVLLELSTILTIHLVMTNRRSRRAAEAAWKYYLMCATGMAFSLYGLILLYSAGVEAGVKSPWLWSSLALARGHLACAGRTLVLASAFIIAGFSVKAGLFPAYMWLPDAHSEAPAPISALLSGCLIYTPLYVLARLTPVLSASGREPCMMLLVIGLASILCGAGGMFLTRDVKRLMAYSSIEHMGILAFTLSLAYAYGRPGLAFLAFNIQAMGHALAKSCAFISSGYLTEVCGSRRISGIDVSVDRIVGWGLVVSMLVLMGALPIPLMLSELIAAEATGSPALLAAYLVIVMAGFATLGWRLSHLIVSREPVRNHILMYKPVLVRALVIILLLTLIPVSIALFHPHLAYKLSLTPVKELVGVGC